jgi:hypothetical protein
MQIDVMFCEADAVDITSPSMAFIFGRSKPSAQPALPRFRAAAKKAARLIAMLHHKMQARFAHPFVTATQTATGCLPVAVDPKPLACIAVRCDPATAPESLLCSVQHHVPQS